MSDKLREFKCNKCPRPCVLVVNVLDSKPDACPYNDPKFDCWEEIKFSPEHETVEDNKTSFTLDESCRGQLEAIQFLDKLKWDRESYLAGLKDGLANHYGKPEEK